MVKVLFCVLKLRLRLRCTWVKIAISIGYLLGRLAKPVMMLIKVEESFRKISE